MNDASIYQQVSQKLLEGTGVCVKVNRKAVGCCGVDVIMLEWEYVAVSARGALRAPAVAAVIRKLSCRSDGYICMVSCCDSDCK